MIGDAKALERAKANASPAFSTCTASDIEAAGLRLDPTSRKVVLIDASDIIGRHNDVRNDKVGQLIWDLIKSLSLRERPD